MNYFSMWGEYCSDTFKWLLFSIGIPVEWQLLKRSIRMFIPDIKVTYRYDHKSNS